MSLFDLTEEFADEPEWETAITDKVDSSGISLVHRSFADSPEPERFGLSVIEPDQVPFFGDSRSTSSPIRRENRTNRGTRKDHSGKRKRSRGATVSMEDSMVAERKAENNKKLSADKNRKLKSGSSLGITSSKTDLVQEMSKKHRKRNRSNVDRNLSDDSASGAPVRSKSRSIPSDSTVSLVGGGGAAPRKRGKHIPTYCNWSQKKCNDIRKKAVVIVPPTCISWLPLEMRAQVESKFNDLINAAIAFFENPDSPYNGMYLSKREKHKVSLARKILDKKEIGYYDLFGLAVPQGANYPFFVFSYMDKDNKEKQKAVPLTVTKTKKFVNSCRPWTLKDTPTKEGIANLCTFLEPFAENQKDSHTEESVTIDDCWAKYSDLMTHHKDGLIPVRRMALTSDSTQNPSNSSSSRSDSAAPKQKVRVKQYHLIPFSICKNLDENLTDYRENFRIVLEAREQVDLDMEEDFIQSDAPLSHGVDPLPNGDGDEEELRDAVEEDSIPPTPRIIIPPPIGESRSRPRSRPRTGSTNIRSIGKKARKIISTSGKIGSDKHPNELEALLPVILKAPYISVLHDLKPSSRRKTSLTFVPIKESGGNKVAANLIWYLCEFILEQKYSKLVIVSNLDISSVHKSLECPHTYCCVTGEAIEGENATNCVALMRTQWSTASGSTSADEMAHIMLMKPGSWQRVAPLVQMLYSWKKSERLLEVIIAYLTDTLGQPPSLIDESGAPLVGGNENRVPAEDYATDVSDWRDILDVHIGEMGVKKWFDVMKQDYFPKMGKVDICTYLLFHSLPSKWPEGVEEILPTPYVYRSSLMYYILVALRMVEHEYRTDLSGFDTLLKPFDKGVNSLHFEQSILSRMLALKEEEDAEAYMSTGRNELQKTLQRIGFSQENHAQMRLHGDQVILIPPELLHQSTELFENDAYSKCLFAVLSSMGAIDGDFNSAALVSRKMNWLYAPRAPPPSPEVVPSFEKEVEKQNHKGGEQLDKSSDTVIPEKTTTQLTTKKKKKRVDKGKERVYSSVDDDNDSTTTTSEVIPTDSTELPANSDSKRVKLWSDDVKEVVFDPVYGCITSFQPFRVPLQGGDWPHEKVRGLTDLLTAIRRQIFDMKDQNVRISNVGWCNTFPSLDHKGTAGNALALLKTCLSHAILRRHFTSLKIKDIMMGYLLPKRCELLPSLAKTVGGKTASFFSDPFGTIYMMLNVGSTEFISFLYYMKSNTAKRTMLPVQLSTTSALIFGGKTISSIGQKQKGTPPGEVEDVPSFHWGKGKQPFDNGRVKAFVIYKFITTRVPQEDIHLYTAS